ncbi:outer membrane protease [Escherichia coli]|nr:outer membrane protease [Escherichia coli]CAD6087125.1 outer membrane protease [Escherichia coli]CAD6149982.1 outer membrane protease [Escherichia coli]
MPYIGLAGQYRLHNVEVNTLFKFSNWVCAHDNDEHYMRDLTFREKTSNSRYYGASVDVGPNTKVFAELNYSNYQEGKGGTQMINNSSGQSASFGGDAAGVANTNYTITAGQQDSRTAVPLLRGIVIRLWASPVMQVISAFCVTMEVCVSSSGFAFNTVVSSPWRYLHICFHSDQQLHLSRSLRTGQVGGQMLCNMLLIMLC